MEMYPFEHHAFDVLEKKIDRLIGMLNQLRQENRELKRENDELKALVAEKDKKIGELMQAHTQTQSMQEELAGYRAKEDRIRSKVENLLEKLQEFEQFE